MGPDNHKEGSRLRTLSRVSHWSGCSQVETRGQSQGSGHLSGASWLRGTVIRQDLAKRVMVLSVMVLQSRASSGTTCLVFLWLCLVMGPDSITQAQAHRSAALSLWQQTGTKKCSQEKGY